MRQVAGIDGCRGGWVIAVVALEGDEVLSVERTADLGAVVGDLRSGSLAAAGIDIPIGLPAAGPRGCDCEARRLLGTRRSSVFPAPLRPVLGASHYQEALVRARAASGKGMSRQAYGILPKVQEVDRLMTPTLQAQLVEVHPEVSFAVLVGRPMSHPKRTVQGRAERLEALHGVFAEVDVWAGERVVGAQPDDAVDALVVAWTARRFAGGRHRQLGGDTDERGLRMEIVA